MEMDWLCASLAAIQPLGVGGRGGGEEEGGREEREGVITV